MVVWFILLIFVKTNTNTNTMRSLADLKQAVAENKQLVWNDPDPIKGNDYTINFIEDIDDEFNDDDFSMYPILIQSNDFGSEAQVYLHEIILKKD